MTWRRIGKRNEKAERPGKVTRHLLSGGESWCRRGKELEKESLLRPKESSEGGAELGARREKNSSLLRRDRGGRTGESFPHQQVTLVTKED